MNPIEEALELDKKETFGTETPKLEEGKTEEKIEVKGEEKKVEGEEKKTTTETNTDPWYKQFEFENEDAAKEFINNSKTQKGETEKPKFANATAESYNIWIENGGVEDFGIFQSVNKFSVSEKPTIEEMVDALVLKQVMEDPDYKGKETLLAKQIKKQYKVNLLGEDAEFTDDDEKEEAELKQIELKKEFKKVSAHFKELQEKAAPKVDAALEARLKDGPTKLKAHLDETLKDFKINIPEVKEDGTFGENQIFSITFDESMQKLYRTTYENLAKAQKYPELTDGSHNQMKAVAAALVLGEKLPFFANDIFKAGLAQGKSDSNEKEIKSKNPSAIVGHETKITGDSKDDTSENIFK